MSLGIGFESFSTAFASAPRIDIAMHLFGVPILYSAGLGNGIPDAPMPNVWTIGDESRSSAVARDVIAAIEVQAFSFFQTHASFDDYLGFAVKSPFGTMMRSAILWHLGRRAEALACLDAALEHAPHQGNATQTDLRNLLALRTWLASRLATVDT